MTGALSVIHGFWCLRLGAALAEIEVVTPRAMEDARSKAGHIERDSHDAIACFARAPKPLRVFEPAH